MKRTIISVLSAVVAIAIIAHAQSGAPSSIKSKPAVNITAAQIQTILKLNSPDKNADRLVKVVDAGAYNFSMNVSTE